MGVLLKRAWSKTAAQSLYYFQDIKLLHTLFSLPFLIASTMMIPAQLSVQTFILMAIALFCARSYAMGCNRLIDCGWDKQNPRTKKRMIPSQRLEKRWALSFVFCSGLLFLFVSWLLGKHLVWFGVPLLIFLAGYSYAKRVHWLVHFYLGACLGLLPLAVGVVLGGFISEAMVCLSVAIVFWVAGFDILYAGADMSFDRTMNLRSIPARFGKRNSQLIGRLCFVIMMLGLIGIGQLESYSYLYYAGLVVLTFLLRWIAEQASLENYHKILPINSWVGVIYLLFFFMENYQ